MLQIKQGSKIKAFFPVFAVLMLARCECDEQVSTIPEPGTSISLGMCLLCLSAASRRYVFRQVGA